MQWGPDCSTGRRIDSCSPRQARAGLGGLVRGIGCPASASLRRAALRAVFPCHPGGRRRARAGAGAALPGGPRSGRGTTASCLDAQSVSRFRVLPGLSAEQAPESRSDRLPRLGAGAGGIVLGSAAPRLTALFVRRGEHQVDPGGQRGERIAADQGEPQAFRIRCMVHSVGIARLPQATCTPAACLPATP